MMLFFLLSLQMSEAPAPTKIDFDLKTFRTPPPAPGRPGDCSGGDNREIVVCAPRREAPLGPSAEMAARYEPKPLMAETGIGGGATARTFVEQVAMPQGQVSKRIMIGIRMPF